MPVDAALFVVTTICLVGLGVVRNRANRQREAVEAIRLAGGTVEYLHEWRADGKTPQSEDRKASRLRQYLGNDYFDDVVAIHFAKYDHRSNVDARWPPSRLLRRKSVTDDVTRFLVDLPDLIELDVGGCAITDEGLRQIGQLRNLEELSLIGTDVTDAGLSHIDSMQKLRRLMLRDTRLTDAGLAHVRRLRNLSWLILNKTQITDAGLVHVQGLTNLTWLKLDDTDVTDAGLVYLRDLSNLHTLGLTGTQVTNDGVSMLRRSLPECTILQ